MTINQFSLIEVLVGNLKRRGFKNIVISPGSRNAPLIEAFHSDSFFQLYTIADERSAAFFGLGLTLQSGIPSVLVCTSGSAVLNYAPGVAEAFYQGKSLIVLSADRPIEMIGQMSGQTIHQQNVLDSFCKGFYQLPQEITTEEQLRYAHRLIEEGLILSQQDLEGPIHFNFPLKEPLYGHNYQVNTSFPSISKMGTQAILNKEELSSISEIWKNAKKIICLIGSIDPRPELISELNRLSKDPRFVILSESTSNLFLQNDFPCIDKTIIPIENKSAHFEPDLLITIGRNVVSKKVKNFLSKSKLKNHLGFTKEENLVDTYGHLSHQLKCEAEIFLKELEVDNSESTYQQEIRKVHGKSQTLQKDYLKDLPFCDFKVFELIYKRVPVNSVIHYGNSSVVRYSNLFDTSNSQTKAFCNRGTSGIDGSLSTSIGYALNDHKLNTIIIGDISFLYDSNGLWNNYIGKNIRIIVINNGGGSIFEIIEGAKDSPVNKEHLKYEQSVKLRGLCETFKLPYYICESIDELENNLQEVYSPIYNQSALIEVNTSEIKNADYLRSFLKKLKENGY